MPLNHVRRVETKVETSGEKFRFPGSVIDLSCAVSIMLPGYAASVGSIYLTDKATLFVPIILKPGLSDKHFLISSGTFPIPGSGSEKALNRYFYRKEGKLLPPQ